MGGGSKGADEFSVTFQLAEKGSAAHTKDMSSSQTLCQLICVTHILPSGSWSEVLSNPFFNSPQSLFLMIVFFSSLFTLVLKWMHFDPYNFQ